VSKIPVIGLCLAAASLIATPALSDSCPPQHVHQYIRAHYAHYPTHTTARVAYRYVHARRHYVLMEEPYYGGYDEYYDASGPYWHARSGWWEWHSADDDDL
jgi:hypothetical protein